MRYRLLGLASSRSASFVLALVASVACSLTEEVRTRPGAPGEIGVVANGGSAGLYTNTGGKGGLDGGFDGNPSGAADGSDGRGAGGSGAHPNEDGGGGSESGLPFDGGEPESCPVDITFTCHDYCRGLGSVNECRDKLRKAAGVKDDGGAYFPDGSVPHELNLIEMVTRCECDCELRYRTPACRFNFDQFIDCGRLPLSIVCATDPDLIDEVPSVEGPCGGVRTNFVTCLETPPPPPRDGGPS
jgi:hypothetical protein